VTGGKTCTIEFMRKMNWSMDCGREVENRCPRVEMGCVN